jgi:hypothetical protein
VGFLLETVYDIAVKVKAAVHEGVGLCLSVGAKPNISPRLASGEASLRVWMPRQKCGVVIDATSGEHDAFRSELGGVHLGRLTHYSMVDSGGRGPLRPPQHLLLILEFGILRIPRTEIILHL